MYKTVYHPQLSDLEIDFNKQNLPLICNLAETMSCQMTRTLHLEYHPYRKIVTETLPSDLVLVTISIPAH
jgi:hypothetical protein